MRLEAILIHKACDLTIILLFWEKFLTLLGEPGWLILLKEQLWTAASMSKMRQGGQSERWRKSPSGIVAGVQFA